MSKLRLSIADAFPRLFNRALQTVEAGMSVFVAGTLLDIPRRDVFAITSVWGANPRLLSRNGMHMAFGGYGLLKTLLQTDPKDHYKFLFQPCESVSLPIPCVDSESELSRVFEVMEHTKIGWLLVRKQTEYAIVTLSDLVPLYSRGVLSTDASLGDVSSAQIFFTTARTRLDLALGEMLARRIRRVFLAGTKKFVSDREILEHIFSPDRLHVAEEYPERMLESTLGEVGYSSAAKVDKDLRVTKLARTFDVVSGAHCLLTAKGLVTPWDLVMKPWAMGRLKIDGAIAPQLRRRPK